MKPSSKYFIIGGIVSALVLLGVLYYSFFYTPKTPNMPIKPDTENIPRKETVPPDNKMPIPPTTPNTQLAPPVKDDAKDTLNPAKIPVDPKPIPIVPKDEIQKPQTKPTPKPVPKPVPKPTPKPVPKPSSPSAEPQGVPPIKLRVPAEYKEQLESQIAILTNKERQKAGLKPLTVNSQLTYAARYKSMDMLQNNFFSHNSPTSGTPGNLLKLYKIPFKTYGENIQYSAGNPNITAQTIVTRWMNSPGHRANILNKSFGKIGVGVVFSSSGDKLYETQLFTD